jgi:hypothetical protein
MNTQSLKEKRRASRFFLKAKYFNHRTSINRPQVVIYCIMRFRKKNINLSKTSAGGAMLLRGLTGYCPVYNAPPEEKSTDTSS